MDKNKEFVIDCIKELIKEMKENNDRAHSNSYEYNNTYIHFKLLDITDYEHNHYGYSVDITVTNPDSIDIVTEYEVFYNDMEDSFKVKTKKSIDMDELLEDLNKKSKS